MRPILVIGASGTVGRHVIAELVARNVPVRALTRKPGHDFPPSIEVAIGDLERPDTLEPALNGVERVFLVWTASAGTVAAAMARRQARPAHRLPIFTTPDAASVLPATESDARSPSGYRARD